MHVKYVMLVSGSGLRVLQQDMDIIPSNLTYIVNTLSGLGKFTKAIYDL